MDQIDVGDLFLLDGKLSKGGRRPELFEVVGKTRARVRLRPIEYELEDVGPGPLGIERFRVFPKHGCYVSPEVVTKGVSASAHTDRRYHATFKVYDSFNQETTRYATHYTKRRALILDSFG